LLDNEGVLLFGFLRRKTSVRTVLDCREAFTIANPYKCIMEKTQHVIDGFINKMRTEYACGLRGSDQ
jgi:hypothetical protein